MTVGIATMANNGSIILAADRMVTRGTTQTEPSRSKIYWWNDPLPHAVVWSGSAAIFGEVIQEYRRFAGPADAKKYPTLQSLVQLYCNCFAELIGSRAEREVLTRLGLDRNSLVSSKVPTDRAMHLIRMVTEQTLAAEDDVQVIFAGQDPHGLHVWTILNQTPLNHDVEAFATIGVGGEHADAQLRFGGYTMSATPAEALMLAHFAKRRAETAPHVGKATDIAIATGNQFSYVPIEMIEALDEFYDAFVVAERAALSTAIRDTNTFMKGLAIQRGLVAEPPPANQAQAPSETLMDDSTNPVRTTKADSADEGRASAEVSS